MILLCLVNSAIVARALAQDWPQFLGPTRNGVYAGTNLSEAWPKDGPTLVWKRAVGNGFAGPAVASGKLILFHRESDEEVVEALNAKSSKQLWRYAYPTRYVDDFRFDPGPRGVPAISQGKVFTLGAEGSIRCVDFETGKEIWKTSSKDDYRADKGYFGFACSPLVAGDVVLLNIGGKGGAGIVALDITNGRLRWKATDDEAGYSSPVLAKVNGQQYAFFLTRAGLAAIELPNGKVAVQYPWRARMSASVNGATPLVVNDLIFLSASYQTGAILLRMKGNKVERVWSGDDILSNHYSTCVYKDQFLYGFDGRQEEGQTLKCVELMTGKVRWQKEGLRAGTVTLAGRAIFILTEQGELIRAAASPAKYQEIGRAQILSGNVRAYPAIADGFIFARSANQLVCYDLTRK